MRKRATALLAAFMAGTLMFGCGGQGSQGSNGNTTPAENSTTTDEQETDGTVEIGDYVAAAKDGKIELPGYTFTLPDDIAQGDYNVAGWARISFDGMWGRIWIYDPNEDLVSQVTKPGFFEIDGIPAGKTMKEALDELKELGEEVPEGAEDIYIDLGENGTYHYYALDTAKAYELFGEEDEDYAQLGIDQARVDTAKSLEGRLDEFVKCFEATDLKLPVIQTAEDVDVQALSNLTLEDLDGNKVRLGDVFAQNKLTMIDIWKTDCGACVESMPDLEELQKSLHDKGFGVLGVNCDVLDENGKADEFLLEDALDIVESTGTTYPTVLADSQFLGLIDVYATPTTLFVDSEGNVVDGPSAGAYPKDMLTGIIEGNLEKVS